MTRTASRPYSSASIHGRSLAAGNRSRVALLAASRSFKGPNGSWRGEESSAPATLPSPSTGGARSPILKSRGRRAVEDGRGGARTSTAARSPCRSGRRRGGGLPDEARLSSSIPPLGGSRGARHPFQSGVHPTGLHQPAAWGARFETASPAARYPGRQAAWKLDHFVARGLVPRLQGPRPMLKRAEALHRGARAPRGSGRASSRGRRGRR